MLHFVWYGICSVTTRSGNSCWMPILMSLRSISVPTTPAALTPRISVISGAVNGEQALVIRATKRPEDSRYAQILGVIRESEQRRRHEQPRIELPLPTLVPAD